MMRLLLVIKVPFFFRALICRNSALLIEVGRILECWQIALDAILVLEVQRLHRRANL